MKTTKKCKNAQKHQRCSNNVMASLILVLLLSLGVFNGSLDPIPTTSAVTADITITSSGVQNVEVLPDSTGSTATSIGVDNVNVSSTCRSGYNLAIFTSVNDNNLYLNGNSSNNQDGRYFSPADGTGTLINSPNTWGFLVSDTVPDSSGIFSAVPPLSNPLYIKTAEQTASSTDIDDDIDIYYGVAISSGLPAGSYKLIPNSSSNNQDGTISYGFTMDPTCEENTITLNAGNGISTLTASGWTDSGTASISKGLHEGETIDLSTITPGYKTGYNGTKYTVTGGTGTLSGSTYTVGDNDGQITISATGLDTPVCTIKGGTGKVYNRSATTLTATSNATNYDTNSVNLTYSFGYAVGSETDDLGNFTTPGTANTYTVAKALFRGARHYGVRVVATDKTDSTITSTCTSGTGSATGTTVANRTIMTLVNAKVNFDATTNGGTLSGTTPIYVAYNMSNVYTGRTNAKAGSIPTAIPPSGKVFDGWYTAAGQKIINADGTMAGNAVTNWSTADGKWMLITTSTTTTSNANKLYAKYVDPPQQVLYDLVAAQSKGTQTLAELRATITTDNSGVYEYDASVFGAASDAASTSKIYYYRGILDNIVGTYGSDGDNETYPNTVVLSSASSKSSLATSDTCWRIVRTTGSGGVKMIYQGKWTGSTCANSTTSAQIGTSAFNSSDNISPSSILSIGYTFNSNYKTTSISTPYSTLFGSNTNYSGNVTDSTIKNYIEAWFDNNINDYNSFLEPSAGYCNDRTMYLSNSTDLISDNVNIIDPYMTDHFDKTTYSFGPDRRLSATAQHTSLNCPRNGADLYTVNKAGNGNKQLTKPVALLTTDESIFAGSGNAYNAYSSKSFLNTGSYVHTLSPSGRVVSAWTFDDESYYTTGTLIGVISPYGISGGGCVNSCQGYTTTTAVYGVRPVISLVSGTIAISGSGTATDPWIVNPPS